MKIFKKIIGAILVVLGILIHLIPFVPGSWLIFLGLELMGLRLLVWDKIKSFLIKKSAENSGSEPRQN